MQPMKLLTERHVPESIKQIKEVLDNAIINQEKNSGYSKSVYQIAVGKHLKKHLVDKNIKYAGTKDELDPDILIDENIAMEIIIFNKIEFEADTKKFIEQVYEKIKAYKEIYHYAIFIIFKKDNSEYEKLDEFKKLKEEIQKQPNMFLFEK